MVKKNRPVPIIESSSSIDCACVIHGDIYSWDYVDRLYRMISRHCSKPINLHVYTEMHRAVPSPYIKHGLLDWGISGPKKAWWYKMQLFNIEYHRGPLLYFDLDTVIVDNIDWICKLPLQYFWSVRDFKYLWRPTHYGVNSSIMWFDTEKFDYVWRIFKEQDLGRNIGKYHGDQDYITDAVQSTERKFFDISRISSWRWQCLDGGYNFSQKRHLSPGTGTAIPQNTSVMIFHGNPKPNKIVDPVVIQHWQ